MTHEKLFIGWVRIVCKEEERKDHTLTGLEPVALDALRGVFFFFLLFSQEGALLFRLSS